jgi:hypothetical protein
VVEIVHTGRIRRLGRFDFGKGDNDQNGRNDEEDFHASVVQRIKGRQQIQIPRQKGEKVQQMCLERNTGSIALDGGNYQKENDACGMKQIT